MNGTVGHSANGLAAEAAHEEPKVSTSKSWRAKAVKEKCVICCATCPRSGGPVASFSCNKRQDSRILGG
jgi:hypothetical protein